VVLRRPGFFVAGACFGAVVSQRWRPLVKRAVVAGVVGGSTLRTGAARIAENLSDLTHEALSEMQANGSTVDAAPSAPTNGSGSRGRAAIATSA
jgi:hypothetical protein